MPRGELVPVIIITAFLTRLGRLLVTVDMCMGTGEMYGPVESGAIWRILGMVSGSAGGMVRCSLRARRRCLGVEVMVGGVDWAIEWLRAWRRWMVEQVAGRNLGTDRGWIVPGASISCNILVPRP